MLGGSENEDEEEDEEEGGDSPAEAEAATLRRLLHLLLPLSRSGSKGRRREEATNGRGDAAAAARATTIKSDDANDADENGSHRAAPAVAVAPRPLKATDPAFSPLPVQHGQRCIVGVERRREIKVLGNSLSRRFETNDALSLALSRSLSFNQ